MRKKTIYFIIKRLMDVIVSFVGIICISPLLVILAVFIKLTSRGPVIFAQERAGKDAVPFTLLKFRTMRTDTDPFGASPKSGQDPRLTKTGKFLRELSLDELPQLFNVFIGNMTLVGPRPLYVSQIPEWNENQKKRLLVKPGLTGLAQISGRGQITIEQKLDLDVQYVMEQSLWLDIKIIFATALLVFARQNIYEDKYSNNQVTRNVDDDGQE